MSFFILATHSKFLSSEMFVYVCEPTHFYAANCNYHIYFYVRRRKVLNVLVFVLMSRNIYLFIMFFGECAKVVDYFSLA